MFTPKRLFDCDPIRNTPDGHIRYVLKPRELGKTPLFVIGMNPSHADEYGLDDTVKNVAQFAEKNGYSHFVMFNLCPLRTPDPEKLDVFLNGNYDDLLENNRSKIEYELNRLKGKPTIFACWGDTLRKNSKLAVKVFLKKSLERLLTIEKLKNGNCDWIRIETKMRSQDYPVHPVPRNKHLFADGYKLEPWVKFKDYLEKRRIPY